MGIHIPNERGRCRNRRLASMSLRIELRQRLRQRAWRSASPRMSGDTCPRENGRWGYISPTSGSSASEERGSPPVHRDRTASRMEFYRAVIRGAALPSVGPSLSVVAEGLAKGRPRRTSTTYTNACRSRTRGGCPARPQALSASRP